MSFLFLYFFVCFYFATENGSALYGRLIGNALCLFLKTIL